MLEGSGVDRLHDALQTAVHLLAGPGEPQAVLAHLETGDGDAARVRGLAGTVEDLLVEEDLDALGDRRHVRALGDHVDAVRDQVLSILLADLVLRRAREGAVGLVVPERVVIGSRVARRVNGVRVLLSVLLDAPALDVLELHDERELVAVDAFLVVDVAGRVGQRDRLRAEVEELLTGELRDVAGAGDQTGLALELLAACPEHLLREVDGAVTRRLGANEAATPVPALARKDARELVPELPVLAVEIADLTTADTDVAGRHVGVRTDVTEELAHEGLAEPHDLHVALALRVEVRTTLAATHREGRQAVLEDLLESQELEDAEVDARVKPEAALVRTDRAVHLDTVAAVDLHVARVVDPRHAEHDDALGLDDPVDDLGFAVLGALVEDGPDRLHDLAHRLMELILRRVLRLDAVNEGIARSGSRHSSLLLLASYWD